MTKDTPTPRTRGGPIDPCAVWFDRATKAEADLSECRAALRELVACKDLHDRIDALDWSLYTFADAERANELQAEYDRRISLAWSAARAILQSDEGEKS